MKRLPFVLLLLFTTVFQTFSQTATKVDEALAYKTAQAFVASHQSFKGQTLNMVSASDIYIYNVGTQGFVIISGSQVLPPVLGWSNQGNFPDLENAPDNFALWIGHYGEMIGYAEANGILPESSVSRQWTDAAQGIFGTRNVQTVSPLVSTQWNQDCFYNEYCPATSGSWWDGGPCGHVYAGCVACAMAQIMKYWNYPTTGFGSHSYVHGTYGQQSANFGTTTYQWDQMPHGIWNSNPAIATIMYHCGVSVNMNYSPSGSGAYSNDVETALRNYFGYCAAKYYLKSSFSEERWIAHLKSELDLSRPVYYSGASDNAGHAFVCDGYDDNDLFHFNFGWSGSGDAYYSTYDVNGYNQGQAIVSSIYPISIQADAHGIIYVTPEGTGDGSSWDNATSHLDVAAAIAKDGLMQVWVKSGVYYGDTTNTESAFYISPNNRVYGSFKGDESPDYDLSQRNFNGNASILDGQHQRRVLTLNSTLIGSSETIWDGFVIRYGAAGSGAGAYINNYVTLSNCTIKHNEASMFGGGVYINSTGGTPHVNLNKCVIRNNSASMGGGICDRLGANYTNCRISNNTASTKGGGIYLYNNTEPNLKNCIISNNTAKDAGAMYARGQLKAYNCDFVMNLAYQSTGGVFNEQRHSKYYNCILWGNQVNGQPNQTDGVSDYEYCAVEGGIEGTQIINLPAANSGNEPGWYVHFNQTAQGAGAAYYNDSWSLHPRSICLNAGKPNTAGLGPVDIIGNPRIQKGRVEIGAYESCASLTLLEDAIYESNTPYWFFNRPLTEPGYYTAVVQTQDCDSVVGLTLMVLEGTTESSETNSLQIWPNPTTGILHLEGYAADKMEVRNLLGQLVLQSDNTDTIDLSYIEKGIYFVTVLQNGKRSVVKIIKE